MKKPAILGLAIFLTGAAWWNRSDIFWFLYSNWYHRPAKILFKQYRAGRLQFFYVENSYLSSRIQSIATNFSRQLPMAEKLVGVSLPDTKVFVYNNWEEKGNHVRDIRIAHANPKDHSLHYIVNEHFDGTRERLDYLLLLQQRYGPPAKPFHAYSSAAALSGVWNQKTLDQWKEFLLQRDLAPAFPEYFLGKRKASEYLLYPWNAVFASFINDRYGWDALIRLYQRAEIPADSRKLWEQYLQAFEDPPLPVSSFRPEFQKGISYAYSNSYDSGYATKKSRESLRELKQNGVRWVAAIPYGFMRSHDSTEVGYSGHSIVGESDESMVALVIDAHTLGMKVMMKPQIWIDHESWPGRIDFPSDANWNRWMESYEDWILHYAVLSELTGADLLCIGTELVQSTLKKPDRWRKIIARVRNVYHGRLVYAANYGQEFERLAFWDALDYMGLDNYYPVRASTKEGEREMRIAFQAQKEKLRLYAGRYNKPILFTEIGYTATVGAGMGAAESNFRTYNEELQKQCYQLAMETYWNEPWFAGAYWWKWFSDPRDRGRNADPHSPHGRLAETVLKRWYQLEVPHESNRLH